MQHRLDLKGQKFGRLSVVKDVTPIGDRASWWACKCDCGSVVTKRGTALSTGHVRSCGCLVKERLQQQGTHNHCRAGAVSPTWYSWKSMLDRCGPTHKSHAYYYDKGIRVCVRWHKFENFLADMGERPAGHTLDRIKNGRGYFKSNCQWATASMQQMNKTATKRFTYAGETKTLTAWSRDARCKVPYCTLHKRVIVYGFSFIESLTTASKKWKTQT